MSAARARDRHGQGSTWRRALLLTLCLPVLGACGVLPTVWPQPAADWPQAAGYAERVAQLEGSEIGAERRRLEARSGARQRLQLALLLRRHGNATERARAVDLARQVLPTADRDFARFVLDTLGERAAALLGERRGSLAVARQRRELSELRERLAAERAAREDLDDQLEALTAIERSIGGR